ncbi:MAG: hypothetical protein K0A99_01515 [Desulfoarculaceae bacterium]|nr:hypothetical protein [Desulfoarculaceae bacterium]
MPAKRRLKKTVIFFGCFFETALGDVNTPSEKSLARRVTAPKNPLTEREVLFISKDSFYNLVIF